MNLLVTIVFVFDASKVIQGLQNVALQKTATQSSEQLPDYAASKAVDGNTSGNPDAHKSCSHTVEGSQDPWWEVDLGDYFLVEHVVVYNRVNCCGFRLTDVHFNVSNDRSTYRRFAFHSGTIPDSKTIQPDTYPMSARWLKIYMEGSAILTLCEVQIMARNKQQKLYYQSAPPELAINVMNYPVPVRAAVDCLQACTRPERDFIMRFVEMGMSSPYVECYCPF